VPDANRYLLLVNPSAGGGRAGELLPKVETAMDAANLDHRTVLTTGIEQGCEQARSAAANGEIPVVMSGDGLIGQVGGTLAEGDVPMGVIPGGRGNDFARVVGIPTEPADAVAVLAGGVTREIDVGVINGRRFLCIASCGFDSDANRIANEAPSRLGNLVYAYGALRALAAWRPARFDLELDGGEQRTYVGYSVGACNSKAYGGGMYAAPDAELDDGLFDVVLCEDMPKWRFLTQMLPKVFKGKHVEMPQVHVMRTRRVRIASDRTFVVYADGDPIAETPATLEILPGALTVLCPS